MASGINAGSVATESLESANEETNACGLAAERITQLGGVPNSSLEGLALPSHSQYRSGESLKEMIQENLVAERIAIEVYEDILKMEEKHADGLAGLLATMTIEKVFYRS